MKYQDQSQFDAANVFGTGLANDAFAQFFVGNSFLNPLTRPDTDFIAVSNVTFEPGCRNNWHRHTATSGGGQVLLCTAGEGWAQIEGQDPISMTEGTVVVIPPNTKHWHGAKSDSWFSHIAIAVPGVDTDNEWLEPVSEDDYRAL